MSDGARVTRRVVCAGVRLGAKGLATLLYPEDAVANEQQRRLFVRGKNMRMICGSVYTIDTTEDFTSVYPGTAKWDGMYKNESLVAAWQVSSRAAEAEHAAKKHERKAGRRNALANLLEDVRKEYLRSSTIGRLVIETQLLSALRYGGDR